MAAPDGTVVVAVDAMGGDHPPQINIDGSLRALELSAGLKVVLVGPKALLTRELKKRRAAQHSRLLVCHATGVVKPGERASARARRRHNSTIHVGLDMVRTGQASAFVSAGHSGAVMTGAVLTLGQLGGVERPALVVRIPTLRGFVTVLDAGANVDCRARHLVQFAEMGHIYARVIERIASPRIALLSNGAETQKGNRLTRSVHTALSKQRALRYTGYIEGFDVFRGAADVVVCDGFVGNIALKLIEGLAETTSQWFEQEVSKNIRNLTGAFLLRRVLSSFRKIFDYQPYGAAPLLGVNGIVLISHGSSTETAICNGILTAEHVVHKDLILKMQTHLNSAL